MQAQSGITPIFALPHFAGDNIGRQHERTIRGTQTLYCSSNK